jgi:hypothetical protein
LLPAGGADVGPAADVYSLGAVLYQILCGQAPYSGADSADVIAQVMQGPASSPSSIANVAPALEAVCERAMNRDPRLRPSAAELGREIEHWLGDEPLASYRGSALDAAARWARRHRTLAAAALSVLVAAVLALSIGTILVTREKDAKSAALRDKADALVREGEQRRLAEQGQLQTRRLLAAAHMRAAVAAWHDGYPARAFELLDAQRPRAAGDPELRGFEWHYLRQQIRGAQIESIDVPGGTIGNVAFAPDGKTLASPCMAGGILMWDTAGRRAAQHLAGAARSAHVSFSPDGRTLAAAGDDGAVRL